MTEDDAFLQDILEHPKEDAPRLAYADWLMERDDPRGLFIEIQCRLAEMAEEDPKYRSLKEQEQRLWEAHSWEWLGPFINQRHHLAFQRGFLEWARLPFRYFFGQRDALFRLGPISHLELVRVSSQARELVEMEQLRSVHHLTLSYNHLNDCGAETLSGSCYLTRLETLDLDHNFIRDPGALAIAESRLLRGLTQVSFRSNRLGAVGKMALADRFGDRAQV